MDGSSLRMMVGTYSALGTLEEISWVAEVKGQRVKHLYTKSFRRQVAHVTNRWRKLANNIDLTVYQFRVCIFRSAHWKGGYVITQCEVLSQFTKNRGMLQMRTSNLHFFCI